MSGQAKGQTKAQAQAWPVRGDLVLYSEPLSRWRGGWRQCVVLRVKKRKSSLFDLGTLRRFTVNTDTLAGWSKPMGQGPDRYMIEHALAVLNRCRTEPGGSMGDAMTALAERLGIPS